MKDGLNAGYGSYLSLFDGVITGEVRNPHSDKVYHRRDIMNFYRDLLFRVCTVEVDRRCLHMLEMIREMLQVPMDIHHALLREISNHANNDHRRVQHPYLEQEMDGLLDEWLSEKPVYEGTDPSWMQMIKMEAAKTIYLRQLDQEYPAEDLHMEQGGLISRMRTDDIEIATDHVFSSSTRIISPGDPEDEDR